MVQGYNYIKHILETTMQEAVDIANQQYKQCQEKDYTATLTRVLDEKMQDLAFRLPGLALNAGLTSSLDAEIGVRVVIEEVDMTELEIHDAHNKIPGHFFSNYKTHPGLTANHKKYDIKCWIEISPVRFNIDPKKVHRGIPFKLNDNGTETVPFTDGPTLPFLRDVPPHLVTNEDKEKDETDWLGKAYDFGQKQYNMGLDMIDLSSEGFLKNKKKISKGFYDLSKSKSKFVKPFIKWKPGEMFQTTQKWARSGSKIVRRFTPWGLGLSGVMVGYELGTDTWDAHTIVDGALVIIGTGILIASVIAGAPVAVGLGLVIAGYGVLDYALNLGEGLDSLIGRDSGLWD